MSFGIGIGTDKLVGIGPATQKHVFSVVNGLPCGETRKLPQETYILHAFIQFVKGSFRIVFTTLRPLACRPDHPKGSRLLPIAPITGRLAVRFFSFGLFPLGL